jgi:hypothetical protein
MTSMSRAAAPARPARRTITGLTAALAATLMTCSLLTPAGASVPPAAQGTAIPGALAAVSCPATNACWAVGSQTAQTPNSAVIARWDGSAWSQVSAPFPAGAQSTSLSSVSCPSVTLCWAVGHYTTARKFLPYVLQWNDTAWSPVTLPRPAGDHAMIPVSVSCSSTADCWEDQAQGGRPLIEHWDGTTWAIVAAPALGAPFNPQLSCVSASDCWMTGPYKTPSRAYTGHWDGSSWSLVRLPKPIGMSAISCLGTACVAVSRDGNPGGVKGPIAEQWNGSAWKVTLFETGPKSASLNGVSCAADGTCLAVGSRGGPSPGPFSELWNGSGWRRLTTPKPSGSFGFSGVSCITASDCWAVGGFPNDPTPTTSLIEHWNGTAWSVAS